MWPEGEHDEDLAARLKAAHANADAGICPDADCAVDPVLQTGQEGLRATPDLHVELLIETPIPALAVPREPDPPDWQQILDRLTAKAQQILNEPQANRWRLGVADGILEAVEAIERALSQGEE